MTYDAVLLDLYGTLVDGYGQPMPGAVPLLERVRQAKWAVVTSCSRAFAERLLQSAGLPLPEFIVSADDVKRGKPAPDCYLLAARLLKVEPGRALVLEDTMQGLSAARAAGMDAVRVSLPQALNAVDLEMEESGALVLRAPFPLKT